MMSARVRALVAVGLGLAALLSGCASVGGAPARTPAVPAETVLPAARVSRPAGPPPLTPSIPGLFRTGVNACGDPYAINATSLAGTIPLLDCPGLAGLQPTPEIAVPAGGEVTIAGLPARASITVWPAGLLRGSGPTFVAVRAGIAVVTIHDHECVSAGGEAEPTTCPLLRIHAG